MMNDYPLNLVDCLLIEKHQNNFTLGRRDKIIEGKDAFRVVRWLEYSGIDNVDSR